jgi:hypothetical protein
MERAGPYRKLSAVSNISLQIPWFVWTPLSALMIISVIIGLVVMASHREISNPFSDYSHLFGDDAGQVALAHGFTCRDSPSEMPYDYCVQEQPNALFSRLFIRLSGDGVIENVFSVSENMLKLGDLGALWGAPEIWLYCETIVASWSDRHIMALIAPSPTGGISYFSDVISVSITRSGESGWKQALMNDASHDCGGVKADSVFQTPRTLFLDHPADD